MVESHELIRRSGGKLAEKFSPISEGTRLGILSEKLSANYYGIPTGVSNVVLGEAYTKAASIRSNIDKISYEADLEELKKNKYVHLGKEFSDEEIGKISEKFNKLVEDEQTSYVRGKQDGRVTSKLVKYPNENIPEIANLLNSRILNVIENLFQSHFLPTMMLCMRNYHVPDEMVREKESFANYWHYDDHPVDALKIFIAVDDIDESKGPLHVARWQDSVHLARNNFDRKESGVPGNIVEREAEIKTFTGEAGSAAICKSNELLHRAGVPAKGKHRDMIMIFGRAHPAPLSDNWLDEINHSPYEN